MARTSSKAKKVKEVPAGDKKTETNDATDNKPEEARTPKRLAKSDKKYYEGKEHISDDSDNEPVGKKSKVQKNKKSLKDDNESETDDEYEESEDEVEIKKKKGSRKENKENNKHYKSEESEANTSQDEAETRQKGKKRAKVDKKQSNKKSKEEFHEEEHSESEASNEENHSEEEQEVKNTKSAKKKQSNKNLKEKNNDEEIAPDTQYEVEKIVDVYFKKNGKREFLIRWKGYKARDDTWEPEEHLKCHELIDEYMKKVEIARNTVPRELREKRTVTDWFIPENATKSLRASHRNKGKQRITYYEAE